MNGPASAASLAGRRAPLRGRPAARRRPLRASAALILLAAFTPSGCSDEPLEPASEERVNPDHLPDPNLVILVTSSADDGPGSLREAVAVAPAGSTIRFAEDLAGQTITLASQILIDEGLTIEGHPWNPVTLSGAGSSRIFAASRQLTIRDLVLTDGNAGIGVFGGAILSTTELTIINSTITHSQAEFGGGVSARGPLTVRNSTIEGNRAEEQGGGIYVDFGGIAEVSNSTISGNRAERLGGGVANFQILRVENSTIHGNSAPTAGGVEGVFFARSTIVAGNEGGDCGDAAINEGFNVNTDGTCDFVGADSFDPLLGPLADNGGPTRTHALGSGSLAIDVGDCGTLTADQRGVARPQGAACDIGAVEFTSVALSISSAGTVDSFTGAVTLRGSLSCSGPLTVDLRVDLSQRQKVRRVSTVAEGRGDTSVPCTGDADWMVTVQPTDGVFRNGKVAAVAVALNSDDPSEAEAVVDLKWSK